MGRIHIIHRWSHDEQPECFETVGTFEFTHVNGLLPLVYETLVLEHNTPGRVYRVNLHGGTKGYFWIETYKGERPPWENRN